MIISNLNNRLKSNSEVTNFECHKNYKRFRSSPDSIVIHYTGGSDGISSAKHLCNDKVRASAHIVLDRSGHIYQCVPFDKIAWHAGKSSFLGRKNYNNFSIGIEIDNAGKLEKISDDYYRSWFGGGYSDNEVVKAVHRNSSEDHEEFWHKYTYIQIEKCFQLCQSLIDHYPSISSVVGHEEISVGRKTDPGPAFPLDELRNKLWYYKN